MNEIEMKKQSFDIQRVSNEIEISDSESLGIVFEILKAVKKQKENITSYWKSAKESAKKTYQDILFKEKQMLISFILLFQNLKSIKSIKLLISSTKKSLFDKSLA